MTVPCVAHLADPLGIARAVVARPHMASSYDRRGGNHDWSNYVRVRDGEAVMMEADGPGCITRIWVADPQAGTVRIYLDGADTPALEGPLAGLFDRLPLSFGIGGESPANHERSRQQRLPMGHTSYCPIPFARSCRMAITPEDDYLYYQVNYLTYPPGTPVTTANPGGIGQTPAVLAAGDALARWDRGEPLLPWDAARVSTVSAPAGGTVEVFSAEGAGVVSGLRIALPAEADAALAAHLRENVWLVAHFDDDEPRDPSIRAPLGPAFLDFGQRPAPRSLLVGADPSGAYYSFLPMPHAASARIRLVNRALAPLQDVRVSILHQRLNTLPPDLYRLRTTWHVETPMGPDHRDYEGAAIRILNLDGRDNVDLLHARAAGHFVGSGFHIDLRDAPTDRAAGEGDEMFFLDDDPRLTHYGTGTEDYLNDAWGMRGYTGPLSGDEVDGSWGDGPQLFGYRLHVPDPVPFVRKGRFTLEHGTGNNCSGLYRSVAYWYMAPAAARTRTEERRWEALRAM